MTKSQLKFETPGELINHLRYVLQLVEKQKHDKNSHLLLTGYIEKHKDFCMEEDCPLKMTKKKRNLGMLNVQAEPDQQIAIKETFEHAFHDSIQKLIQVLDRMYLNGIKKFKNSCKLRISYAFFLLERMNNKKKALEELIVAENLKPDFDEQFLIYRYKKMIEDSLDDNMNNENGGQNNLDIVGMIAYENHKNMCEQYIRDSSINHKEFWMELLEEMPNLEKLSIIGNKINITVKNAKDNWKELNKINSNEPTMLKLYGKFSISV